MGNVFEGFSTLMEGQVSQLHTSMTSFEAFMTKSLHLAPLGTVMQIEACSIVREIQSGSMAMVATVLDLADEGFSLPAWLG